LCNDRYNFFRGSRLKNMVHEMKRMIVVAVLLMTGAELASSQVSSKGIFNSKTLVYVSHHGEDRTGTQFLAAVKQELSKSSEFEVAYSEAYVQKRLRFYMEISTIEATPDRSGNLSAVSVVIENMGLPNSYPVRFKWYHKVFLVETSKVNEMSRQFVADMGAHWCNTITNAVGNCPKELLFPTSVHTSNKH